MTFKPKMSNFKTVGIILLIILIITVFIVLFYFFYWKKRNTGKELREVNNDINHTSTTAATTATTETARLTSSQSLTTESETDASIIVNVGHTTDSDIDDNDDEQSDGSIEKWKEFNENKKNNYIKITNDIKIDNQLRKAQEMNFNEQFQQPYENDDTELFDYDIITNKPQANKYKRFDNDYVVDNGIDSTNEWDINKLDDIDDFENRGFKNIDESVEIDEIKPIQLINDELF